MRTISATEASRRFSDLLDAIEAGETVTVTRGNRVIAELRPARARTGSDLDAALRDISAPHEEFAASITETVGLLTENADPWAVA